MRSWRCILWWRWELLFGRFQEEPPSYPKSYRSGSISATIRYSLPLYIYNMWMDPVLFMGVPSVVSDILGNYLLIAGETAAAMKAFAYMLVAADAAGAEQAVRLRGTDTCTDVSAFCVQADISVALGFAAFLFLGLSSLLSGFRAVSFFINGSRFHL